MSPEVVHILLEYNSDLNKIDYLIESFSSDLCSVRAEIEQYAQRLSELEGMSTAERISFGSERQEEGLRILQRDFNDAILAKNDLQEDINILSNSEIPDSLRPARDVATERLFEAISVTQKNVNAILEEIKTLTYLTPMKVYEKKVEDVRSYYNRLLATEQTTQHQLNAFEQIKKDLET